MEIENLNFCQKIIFKFFKITIRPRKLHGINLNVNLYVKISTVETRHDQQHQKREFKTQDYFQFFTSAEHTKGYMYIEHILL